MGYLSPDGRKLIECAFARHARAMERATSALTARKRTRRVALLKKAGPDAQALLGK